MRVRGATFLAVVVGCYEAPAGEPCAITCTVECPGDLTCTAGFCVGPGEMCAPEFSQVATGGGFACAIDASARLWCWGSNEHHQVDPGDAFAHPLARRIGNDRWQMISAGRGHACGISDGRMLCWGANDRGQITSAITGDVKSPIEIEVTGGPQTWSGVFAGWNTTCAIGEGRLYCWGENSNGELGIGNMADTGSPTPVMTPHTDWLTVSHGANNTAGHTCAISRDAGLFCWGRGNSGELGDGASTGSDMPVLVQLQGVTSVAAAAFSTCATTMAGELYCWGYTAEGATGDPAVIPPGAPSNIATPTLASALIGWTEVSSSRSMSCGVRQGDVYCWGTSEGGTGFGDGIWYSANRVFVGPIASGATMISLGRNQRVDDRGESSNDIDNVCFIAGGAVRCWGDNRFGQLGQGAATMAPSPVEISGTRQWTHLTTAYDHACGIEGDDLACWGGQLGAAVDGTLAGDGSAPCNMVDCDRSTPFTVGKATAVAVGIDHTCALDNNKIKCWGQNGFQQLGGPSPLGPTPTEVTGDWTDLFDVHGYGACARTGGQTHCWGASLSTFGPPAPFTELDAMTSLEIGGITVAGYRGAGCFLSANELSCFGDNSVGQYGNGSPTGTCGNAICEGDECAACSGDCPTQCPTCGNLACDFGETVTSCPGDCNATGTASRLGRTYLAIGMGWEVDNGGPLACGVKLDGTIQCWGKNRGGVIVGAGDTAFAPVDITGPTGCTDVAVGDRHACALCGDDILCWGDHRKGAIGSGTITAMPITSPRAIADVLEQDDRWVEVSAGYGFSCARSERGRGFCWGANPRGALGNGAMDSTVPVVVRPE